MHFERSWKFAKSVFSGGNWTPSQITATILLLATALMLAFVIPPRFRPAGVTPAQQIAVQQALYERRELIIPVANVHADDLSDTWGAARAGGRTHEGIDIMAPQGTPVLAAADGTLVRFFDSERGGITIYQFDAHEHYVFYYAHLSARANVHEGQAVRQGDVIAFVGMTGNAPVPHLHFEIQRLTDEHKWWKADSINPYPYLLAGRAPS